MANSPTLFKYFVVKKRTKTFSEQQFLFDDVSDDDGSFQIVLYDLGRHATLSRGVLTV